MTLAQVTTGGSIFNRTITLKPKNMLENISRTTVSPEILRIYHTLAGSMTNDLIISHCADGMIQVIRSDYLQAIQSCPPNTSMSSWNHTIDSEDGSAELHLFSHGALALYRARDLVRII